MHALINNNTALILHRFLIELVMHNDAIACNSRQLYAPGVARALWGRLFVPVQVAPRVDCDGAWFVTATACE